MLSRAAGVVSWELAFLPLPRVGVLSVMLHPTLTDVCEFRRGPGMLSLMEERLKAPTKLGSFAQKSVGPTVDSACIVAMTLTSAPTLASLL